jgi:hypothetical protein
MPNETTIIIVSSSVEEVKSMSSVVQDGDAVDTCSAKCPTCQQSCEYTAGHAGLHHCEKGHEWA